MAMSEQTSVAQEALSTIAAGINSLGGWIAIILMGLVGNFYYLFFGILLFGLINFVALIFCCKGKKVRRRK